MYPLNANTAGKITLEEVAFLCSNKQDSISLLISRGSFEEKFSDIRDRDFKHFVLLT